MTFSHLELLASLVGESDEAPALFSKVRRQLGFVQETEAGYLSFCVSAVCSVSKTRCWSNPALHIIIVGLQYLSLIYH